MTLIDFDYGKSLTDALEREKKTLGEYLDEHIKVFKNADLSKILTGQKYYDNESDILFEDAPKDADGNTDDSKPDWRIVANFHSNLVDQKVSYLIAEPINFKADEHVLDVIGNVFDDSFDDLLNDVLTATSNKGIEWVHVYYNQESELKFKQIPSEQIIPLYDDYGNLMAVIRNYFLHDIERVEFWEADKVTYFMRDEGELKYDYYWGEAVQSHFSTGSWGRVPFVAFRNNTQETGDIFKYKSLVDAFNRRLSDMQNTFVESTDLIYVLRGYEGTNLGEFMRNLKHYKAIKVGAESGTGVETITIKIPVEETKQFLQMLREMIYDFGRGVDYNADKFGNSPSGVALKVLFSSLDLKAKQLERKTRVAIKELLYFVFMANNISLDPNEVEMTFKYNRLSNDLEDSQIAMNSVGMISDLTIISNHPWVDDPQGELDRMNEDNFVTDNALPTQELSDVNESRAN